MIVRDSSSARTRANNGSGDTGSDHSGDPGVVVMGVIVVEVPIVV